HGDGLLTRWRFVASLRAARASRQRDREFPEPIQKPRMAFVRGIGKSGLRGRQRAREPGLEKTSAAPDPLRTGRPAGQSGRAGKGVLENAAAVEETRLPGFPNAQPAETSGVRKTFGRLRELRQFLQWSGRELLRRHQAGELAEFQGESSSGHISRAATCGKK